MIILFLRQMSTCFGPVSTANVLILYLKQLNFNKKYTGKYCITVQYRQLPPAKDTQLFIYCIRFHNRQ